MQLSIDTILKSTDFPLKLEYVEAGSSVRLKVK